MEKGLFLLERHVCYIYREVLLGMREMFQRGILHRDIKNANILLHIEGKDNF